MGTVGSVIFCLLLLLFSFGCLGVGAVGIQEGRKERSTWKAAPGTVKNSQLRIQKGSALPFYPTRDQKSYTNTVEFTAVDGQAFTVDPHNGGKALPANQSVTIHYDPKDPEHTARLASPAGRQASGYALQVLSVVLLLAAAGIGYVSFFG
ncbi:DUF3592 domain-containing protein [Nocardia sp. NPDC088792]|uniref:DUF3592 domain-containing protein n=1 Tax=Nocardia sp. NPDC088792 TaxID=3364332 RepID=UPI0038132A88